MHASQTSSLSHNKKVNGSSQQSSSIHEKYTNNQQRGRNEQTNTLTHDPREKNETIRHTHTRTRINLKNNDGNTRLAGAAVSQA
jgi:hypothetical protein